ncbi:glycosyltransferase family 2 protein [Flammeovirga kamogawensis]|uniref:Glycosyltransferase n=1 Tax=Flammeovirga kamogawensis TaxID=373891 RepID=A0ABX8GTI7_9BACT|nr:glycosyltransferase [Flammeovirga kamogawensis]MBB6462945.1 glycosyltransferase involved in cell wall biosynthesis [Flammeovirga kamogawensis]QWG06472.1 glycosyltransferase [Flammeovirga kamogawensis]TRX68301.1 glycosyltransferase [Flammeovirga kamogawensis]
MTQISNISAVMILKDAEKSLRATLDSLRGFEEVIILDNGSSDKSLEIASSFKNVKIFHSPFIGFGPLKNLAASYASNDWVFSIDSDEIITSRLYNSIKGADLDSENVYHVQRKNAYDGTIIDGANWGDDWVKRLYKKSNVSFYNSQVHEVLNTKKYHLKKLKGVLKHESYSNVNELLDKQRLYTTLFAQQNANIKSISSLMIVLKTLFTFIQSYFLKRGFLFGWKGLLISYYNSSTVFYKYSKLKEQNKSLKCSILVTTYNRVDALKIVLESIKLQSVLPYEVIIADDGSNEETKLFLSDIVNKFPIPVIHKWQEDRGFRVARARNNALASCKGDYIIMIDGDMCLNKNFIKTYIQNARKGYFLQGGRVLLSERKTNSILGNNTNFSISLISKGIKNRFNTLNSKLLSRIFSKRSYTDKGARTCNLGVWREDVVKVNGFDNRFVGWGREDSEFVVRLINNGVKRVNFKFGGIAYHLYHHENSRSSLPENDLILEESRKNNHIITENGLNEI